MVKGTSLVQRYAICASCCFFTFILAACEVGGTYTPVATPVPSPLVSLVHLSIYQGQGYFISYPQNWIVTQSSNGTVTFTNPQGLAFMVIEVLPNPGGGLTSHAEIENRLRTNTFNLVAYRRISISPTVVVGGDTWNQGAANGNIVIKERSISVAGKMVLLADNHPASSPATNMFVIRYAAVQAVFDVADVTYFQPMLKSFKFV